MRLSELQYYFKTYAGIGPYEAYAAIRELRLEETSILYRQTSGRTILTRIKNIPLSGTPFAREVRIEYEGGPPNRWKWYKGSLESFLIDCLLQEYVRYGTHIPTQRPGPASQELSPQH